MQLEVTPLAGEQFGAVVTGWEPSEAPDPALVVQVREALADHLVLVFRGHRQPLDDELVRLAEAFGELIKGSEWLRDAGSRAEILPVTNTVDADGIPLGTGGAGQLEWHADYSYVPRPARESFLNAVELPESGPRTSFVNQYHTLETLPPELVEQLRSLRARHHVAQYVEGGVDPDRHELDRGFDAKRARDSALGIERPAIPEAEHPVVLRHPHNGRELLYVNKGLTDCIIGMDRADSSALLKRLHQHGTRPEAVYAHEWHPGDLVVFDALAGLHRRESWASGERRVMRQLSTTL